MLLSLHFHMTVLWIKHLVIYLVLLNLMQEGILKLFITHVELYILFIVIGHMFNHVGNQVL